MKAAIHSVRKKLNILLKVDDRKFGWLREASSAWQVVSRFNVNLTGAHEAHLRIQEIFKICSPHALLTLRTIIFRPNSIATYSPNDVRQHSRLLQPSTRATRRNLQNLLRGHSTRAWCTLRLRDHTISSCIENLQANHRRTLAALLRMSQSRATIGRGVHHAMQPRQPRSPYPRRMEHLDARGQQTL